MGACALPLPPFKIAVGGGSAALARRDAVGVHRQTHRAARPAPFKTGGGENAVEAFGFRLRLDQPGTGHDQRRFNIRRHLAPLQDAGGDAQIFDARVGAGADEDRIERNIAHRLPLVQSHIIKRARISVALVVIARVGKMRHHAADIDHHFRRRAPAYLRCNRGGIEHHFGVKPRILVADQRAPIGFRRVPQRALRRTRPPAQIGERRLIDCDQTGACARFNRHIAHRHPPFHRKRADGRAGELQRVAGAACGADGANHRQHQILGEHPRLQRAVNDDAHRLRLLLRQTLRRQHMLHLARADAESERGKGAMRGRMRIAANHRHPRQRQALFRADHMHNPLPRVAPSKQTDAELGAVALQRLHLRARNRVLNLALRVQRRHIVVGHRLHRIDPPRLAPGKT